MCGIVGVFAYKTKQPVDRDLLHRSADLLAHRGPDGSGSYFDDANGVGFGHRRLSIIDLKSGDQPMCNEDGSVWLIFNGELYNYRELRAELKRCGHRFKTESDSEVVIHAYEEYGDDCVRRFNGIFAFAMWDATRKRIFVARDHFGVKPLYYYDDGSRFIFASELKAILPWISSSRELDEEALALCFWFRHTPAPFTLLKGVRKLAAAHSMHCSTVAASAQLCYWDEPIAIDRAVTEGEWIESIREMMDRAVHRQMVADVPIGISLSGGLDSGAILALMARHTCEPVHAFTVSFEGIRARDDETERARSNAALFNAEFTLKRVSQDDYLSFFDRYLWHLEEPIGNESAVAYYFVAEMARGIVKVLLNGQGADEPFAGYDRYIGMHYGDRLRFMPPRLIRAAASLQPNLNRRSQLKQLAEYVGAGSLTERIALACTVLRADDHAALFGPAMQSIYSTGIVARAIEEVTSRSASGTPVERMLVHDMFTSLSENLLLCEDKMAMAASIEARVPFLDVEFATRALQIPIDYKIRGKTGKHIHKKSCEHLLPRDVIYQRKIGFSNPLEAWMKDSLGRELFTLINEPDSITRRYLHKPYVERLYQEHLAGRADRRRFLFLLLSVEKWRKIFLT